MLATCELEQAPATLWSETEHQQSGWARDFSSEQRKQWGRWRGQVPPDDPLHSAAPHWTVPESTAELKPVADVTGAQAWVDGTIGVGPEGVYAA